MHVARTVTGTAVLLDCWRPGRSPRDESGKPLGIHGRDCCGVLANLKITTENIFGICFYRQNKLSIVKTQLMDI